MGYSNGQLETSSGTGRGERGEPGLPGIGFNLTDDGNFDLDSKRLTFVADPVDDQDATTKKYVDDENARQDIAINSKAGKDEVALLSAKDNIFMNNFRIFNLPNPSGPQQPATKNYVDQKNAQQDIAINSKAERDEVLLLDGSKSMTGNLQMGKKKITDLGDGSDDGDAVNFSQLLSHTDNHQVNYHLQPSFTFCKNQTIINPINIPNVIPNHNHLDLYITSKVSSNDGFGGQAWVSLRMTNTLKAGLYTVVFETFAGLFGSTTLNDETLITQVYGDANHQVINFSHDYQTTHSKAYIQFTSNGQAGEITFEIRYYGSSYNQNLKFLFFSRVISGRQNNPFNHALFNVNSVQYQNQILYFKDINLNENRIIKLQDPIDDNDAATKGYVDGKVVNVDLNGYLRRDGSLNMTGNLKMGSKKITDLDDGISDGDAVNYSQLIRHTTDHNRQYQLVSSPNFYRDFGDKGALTKSRFQISGHLHLDLYDVGVIEGRGTPSKHEAWSSLKISNTLERGIYTVVFEIFSTGPLKASSLTSMILNDETLLYSVHGDSHFQIITFNHGWESDSGGNTPHSKAYIQFSSDGQPGEIKFQIRYYGEVYNQSLLGFLFYSRVLRGKHTNTFDHQLFDVKETESGNAFLFFENIKMNDNQIFGLPQPTGPQQPATKKYVDDNALLLSGGNMTGSIIMQGIRIHSLPIPTG